MEANMEHAVTVVDIIGFIANAVVVVIALAVPLVLFLRPTGVE